MPLGPMRQWQALLPSLARCLALQRPTAFTTPRLLSTAADIPAPPVTPFQSQLGTRLRKTVIVSSQVDSIKPEHLIRHVGSIPGRNRKPQPLVVFFLTPSFSTWLLDDNAFLLPALTKLYRKNCSHKQYHALVAVVDRLPVPSNPSWAYTATGRLSKLPPPPFSKIGFEGMGYAVMDVDQLHRESLRKPCNGGSGKSTGTIDIHVESSIASASGTTIPRSIVQLPLANTIFHTGQASTMFHTTWTESKGSFVLEKKEHLQHASFSWPTSHSQGAQYGSLSVPLTPFTVPRRIEAALGNIIRRIEGPDQNSSTASQELEETVPRYFAAKNIPAHAMKVWALVIPEGAAPSLNGNLDEVSFELNPSSFDINEAFQKLWREDRPACNDAISFAMSRGARLHRVLSGGGGWGKKAGLLSLDPEISYEDHTSASQKIGVDFLKDFDVEESALKEVARPGESIQFFVAGPDDIASLKLEVKDHLSKHRTSPLYLELGTIPSTIDQVPSAVENLESSELVEPVILVFRGSFGALSEGGMSITRETKSSDKEASVQVQSKVDVPFSRFTAFQLDPDIPGPLNKDTRRIAVFLENEIKNRAEESGAIPTQTLDIQPVETSGGRLFQSFGMPPTKGDHPKADSTKQTAKTRVTRPLKSGTTMTEAARASSDATNIRNLAQTLAAHPMSNIYEDSGATAPDFHTVEPDDTDILPPMNLIRRRLTDVPQVKATEPENKLLGRSRSRRTETPRTLGFLSGRTEFPARHISMGDSPLVRYPHGTPGIVPVIASKTETPKEVKKPEVENASKRISPEGENFNVHIRKISKPYVVRYLVDPLPQDTTDGSEVSTSIPGPQAPKVRQDNTRSISAKAKADDENAEAVDSPATRSRGGRARGKARPTSRIKRHSPLRFVKVKIEPPVKITRYLIDPPRVKLAQLPRQQWTGGRRATSDGMKSAMHDLVHALVPDNDLRRLVKAQLWQRKLAKAADRSATQEIDTEAQSSHVDGAQKRIRKLHLSFFRKHQTHGSPLPIRKFETYGSPLPIAKHPYGNPRPKEGKDSMSPRRSDRTRERVGSNASTPGRARRKRARETEKPTSSPPNRDGLQIRKTRVGPPVLDLRRAGKGGRGRIRPPIRAVRVPERLKIQKYTLLEKVPIKKYGAALPISRDTSKRTGVPAGGVKRVPSKGSRRDRRVQTKGPGGGRKIESKARRIKDPDVARLIDEVESWLEW